MTATFNNEFDKILKKLIKSLQEMENGQQPFDNAESSTESGFDADSSGAIDGTDKNKENQPMYYGYSITTDENGNPVVKEFGNVRPPEELRPSVGKNGMYTPGLAPADGGIDNTREPIVDSFFDKKHGVIKIIAEMPGVQKEDIDISVTEDNSHVQLSTKDTASKKYQTKVPLEGKVKSDSVHNLSYSNGILEVSFEAQDKQDNNNSNNTDSCEDKQTD